MTQSTEFVILFVHDELDPIKVEFFTFVTPTTNSNAILCDKDLVQSVSLIVIAN